MTVDFFDVVLGSAILRAVVSVVFCVAHVVFYDFVLNFAN